jgi:hypothetical protein
MAARASTGRRGPLAKPVGRRNSLYRFRKGQGIVANRHRMKPGRRLAVYRGNSTAIHHHSFLQTLVNGLFTMGMILAAVLMLVAAAAVGGPVQRRGPVRVATATVTIVQTERIAPAVVAQRAPKEDRQISVREAKPLFEFY